MYEEHSRRLLSRVDLNWGYVVSSARVAVANDEHFGLTEEVTAMRGGCCTTKVERYGEVKNGRIDATLHWHR